MLPGNGLFRIHCEGYFITERKDSANFRVMTRLPSRQVKNVFNDDKRFFCL